MYQARPSTPEPSDSLLAARNSPETAREPQPFYRRLRDEAPVLRDGGHVTLSRHADVEHAFRHPELFSSGDAVALGNARPLIPLQIDPPEHKKYRKLLDPLFAPREMARLEDDVARLTNELVDRFADRGSCEFNGELAVPLPCTVFLRLLGLPGADLDLFLRWKDDIIRPEGSDTGDLERQQEVRVAAGMEMYGYFQRVLEERRSDPRDDLLTRMLAMRVDGDALGEGEVLEICFLFLIAGLDTVTDSLDCFFAFLARHPDHRRQLVEDPAIVPSAVEELLRWESPVPGVARRATADVELSGCPVHAGDLVGLSIGAANTDERFWDRPDTVDLRRNPNPHYAFGGGIHRCLGSHLARLELRVALTEWHRRIPDYRIPDGVELVYTPSLRQVHELPLVWDA